MTEPVTLLSQPAPAGRIEVGGIPVDLLDLDGVLSLVSCWLADDAGGARHIVTVNPEYVVAARRNARFRFVLRSAGLATADGVGILLAARLLGLPVPPRLTGNDLVEAITGLRDGHCRIFLLGAGEGVAGEAAAALQSRHPGTRIVGAFAGDPSPGGWPAIREQLAKAGPTVLFVAFGHPKQDLWIATYREQLALHGILVTAGVGGAFDYLSGRAPRAPGLLRRLGLEWLYRLIRQPWRWRRQLALPVFLLLVLGEAAGRFMRRDRMMREREGHG